MNTDEKGAGENAYSTVIPDLWSRPLACALTEPQ
jgi:hypothetical protein